MSLYGPMGDGGSAGTATVTVGSSSAAFSGTISTTSSGTVGNGIIRQYGPNGQGSDVATRLRTSGAAIAAYSIGGYGFITDKSYSKPGGNGGDGAAVTITVYGTSSAAIKTSGSDSPAVHALSAGGAADDWEGDGADIVGGNGASVTVKLTGGGTIQTEGKHSSAVMAQSLGGRGTWNYDGKATQAGAAGSVTVTNDFAITTNGNYSHGIVAQSASAAYGGADLVYPGEGSVLWGDASGSSPSSSTVTVTNAGDITTYGVDSHGIVAQSLGGGGGLLVATTTLSTDGTGVVTGTTSQNVGGYSGSSDGHEVTVTNSGNITTRGGYATSGSSPSEDDASLGGSIAILAQSIGGGGGMVTGSGASSGTTKGSYSTIGGAGSSSGDASGGNSVTVTNTGNLTTYGSEGHGIVAQSVGGGGGAGRNKHGLFLSVGGKGGPGGDGGTVTVSTSGRIVTSGDYASGVIAQSIGGGGGAGGKATAWGAIIPTVSVGGTGGKGGGGGNVTLERQDDSYIYTKGYHAPAIVLQSIGGGGGTGGAAKSYNAGAGWSLAFSSGGHGGSGGAGGDVYAHVGGTVKTAGKDSPAVIVQSLGGGGGQGGTASSKALAAGVPVGASGKSVSLSIGIAHGGDGGSGSDGSKAYAWIEDSATVSTQDDGASGLIVQSVGGGGGQGGDATAASGSASLAGLLEGRTDGIATVEDATLQFSLNLALGGTGGKGGDGGIAYAHNLGAISTTGDFAEGMVVHSTGGGGGHGGTGESHSVSGFGDSTFTLSVSLGGSGGDGGDGGTAKAGVSSSGSITTAGTNSDALIVQSIGGGGGIGGSGSGDVDAKTQLTIGLGGSGGSGGTGGTAYAWNAGKITTSGDFSSGMVAQSIGGGGGKGGSGTSSVTHSFEFAKTLKEESDIDVKAKWDLAISLKTQIGASGGDGGDGGAVIVGLPDAGQTDFSYGTITTSGTFSDGIIAQSIGGGGGLVGTSSNKNKYDAHVDSVEFAYAIHTFGGSGGADGKGGTVSVYAANITTSGFGSNGVVAQSIGGGGGKGVTTGYALDAVTLIFGAEADDADDMKGGSVAVRTLGETNIITSGDIAMGVVAQSIGGGGGLAGVALGTSTEVNSDAGSNVIQPEFGVSGSGDHDDSFDGGTVSVQHYGSLTTTGDRSVGIVAQSIGAGGGLVVASAQSISYASFSSDQGTGAGQEVTVELHNGSSIATTGDGAVGILAQSLGGGGGVGADLNQKLNVYYLKDGGKYAHGSKRYSSKVAISVHSEASISTTGSYAHGILAQSVAGSGGIFATSSHKTYAGSLHLNDDNTDGDIDIDLAGSVSVTADNAWGIWAQVQDGSIEVTIDGAGSLIGTTSSDVNGGAAFAAISSGGSATISNSGTVTGNVVKNVAGQETWSKDYSASSLADGAVRMSAAAPAGQALFANQGSGTFATGTIADLDTVLNAGTLSIGGSNRTLKTTVTGDLVGVGTSDSGSAFDVGDAGLDRSFTPVSYFEGTAEKSWRTATSSRGGLIAGLDVDMEKRTGDQLVVRGDFAGTWGTILNPYAMLPNVRTDFIKVAGADLSDTSILSTLVYRFTDVTTSDTGWKGFEVKSAHFEDTGVAMGANATGVSHGLQSAWDNLASGGATTVDADDGGPSIAQAFAAFHAATPSTLEQMLAVVASQTTVAGPAGAPQGAVTAANSVLSCPAFTTGVALQEGECVWGRFLGARAERDATDGSIGYEEQTTGLQAGGQKALGDGWFLGGSLSYEDSWFTNDAGTEKVEANSFTAAAALKKEVGAWLFALAGGAGYTWGESSRYLSLGSLSAVAEADPTSAFVFGRARASYEIAFDTRFYMRPMVDLDVITVHQEGYRESGAGGLNLIVDDATKTVFGVTPGVEFGARLDMGYGLPARLFAGLGVSFLSDDTWESTARFAGITAMDQFTTIMPINDTVGLVTAGIDLQKVHGMQLKLQYDGAFADGYQSHGGSLRFGYRF